MVSDAPLVSKVQSGSVTMTCRAPVAEAEALKVMEPEAQATLGLALALPPAKDMPTQLVTGSGT
jgi:hypothetical protein